jgi:hypothetical protein
MSNKERDRILREARAMLDDRRPAPYVARPRMIGDVDPLERESFEPEPEPEPQPATWGPWEAWIQARIEAALIVERQAVAAIMAEALGQTIARERRAAQRELHAQVGELRIETARLEHAMRHLSELIQLEKNRSLDLPALPRHDLN